MIDKEEFSKLLKELDVYINQRRQEDFEKKLVYYVGDKSLPYTKASKEPPEKKAYGGSSCSRPMSYGVPDTESKKKEFQELDDYIKEREKQTKTFRDQLFEYMNQKNLSDKDIYSAVGMDVKDFNKIKNNINDKSVPVDKAVLIAFALKLTFEEMEAFIGLTGRKLKMSDRSYIIEFFFKKQNYNIDELNEALYRNNQSLLVKVKGDEIKE